MEYNAVRLSGWLNKIILLLPCFTGGTNALVVNLPKTHGNAITAVKNMAPQFHSTTSGHTLAILKEKQANI